MPSDTSVTPKAVYQLRKTKKRYMIDKGYDGTGGFEGCFMPSGISFGPFKSPETARDFMIKHGGQP